MNIRDEANMLFQQNFNIDLIYTNTYYVLWWNICLLHLIPITRQKTIFKESMLIENAAKKYQVLRYAISAQRAFHMTNLRLDNVSTM